jgi:hypothetical protein
MSDGYIELQYYPVVRNILVNKNYRTIVKKFNIYTLKREELLEAERLLCQIDKRNLKSDSAFTNLFMLLKSIVNFHKILNPLIYISADYLEKRFPENELIVLREINSKYEDLIYFIRKSFALKILDTNQLLIRALELLDEGDIQMLNQFQKPYYNDLHTIYSRAKDEIIDPSPTTF